MAVSKALRFQILRRDLFTCRYCGRRVPDVALEVDHVIPRVKGGEDVADNLIAACFECNRGKSDSDLDSEAPPFSLLTLIGGDERGPIPVAQNLMFVMLEWLFMKTAPEHIRDHMFIIQAWLEEERVEYDRLGETEWRRRKLDCFERDGRTVRRFF